MGCAQSKRVEANIAVDVYRPSATSISLFDISSIEEPWLISTVNQQEELSKPSHVPATILEKLDASDAPHSWYEVSEALQDLNHLDVSPASHNHTVKSSEPLPKKDLSSLSKKNNSFHTLEELDAQLSKKTTEKDEQRAEEQKAESGHQLSMRKVEGIRPLSQNLFIVRDRLEREATKTGRVSIEQKRPNRRVRRDPLSEFPEKCPPGGEEAVVLYTTTLRGVRRTFEDCEKARAVVEAERVVVDERDVSLHGGYLAELRGLLGEGSTVPKLIVRGRYVGGVEEMVQLSECGRLAEIFEYAGVRKPFIVRRTCEGCGGARFLLCMKCNGSCKVVGEDVKEIVRCSECNENGLVQCPLCHPQPPQCN